MQKTDTAIILLVFCVVILTAVSWLIVAHPVPEPPAPVHPANPGVISDNFTEGYLNPAVWTLTQDGDARKRVADVLVTDAGQREGNRLRLGIDTIGTRDDTVKYFGVGSIDTVTLVGNTGISFDIDWNNQTNGCYFSAAVYLCPTVTGTNPEQEKNWLRFEYIGVPPGQNARAQISLSTNGTVKDLYTEGWPAQRTGRVIGYQRVVMVYDGKGLTVMENGKPLYHTGDHSLPFDSAHLYLQISSHSNYPFREIYFDNVTAVSTT